MKKIIAITMICVLIIMSPGVHLKKVNAATAVGATVVVALGKAIVELLVVSGLAYTIVKKDTPYWNIPLIPVTEYKKVEGGIVNFTTKRVAYQSKPNYEFEFIVSNGVEYFINPDWIKAYEDNGVLNKIIEYSKTLEQMSVKNLYQFVQYIKEYAQGAVTNNFGLVCKQMLNNVASYQLAIHKVTTGDLKGFAMWEKQEIENDMILQNMRTNVYLNQEFALGDDYIIYRSLIKDGSSFTSERTWFICGKNINVFPYTNDMGIHLYGLSHATNYIKIHNFKYEQDGSIGYGYSSSRGFTINANRTQVLFASDNFLIDTKYSVKEWPYINGSDVIVKENYVYENLTTGIMDIPADGIIEKASVGELDVAEYVGNPSVELTYDDAIVVTPDASENEGIFMNIFGWLQRIWEAITSIPLRILNGLLQILKDFATWLFVPSGFALDAHVNDMMLTMENQTGVLTYPLTMTIKFFNMILNTNAVESKIKIPRVEYKGYVIIPGMDFYLSDSIDQANLRTLYDIYMAVVNFMFVIGLSYLAYNKWNEFMKG